VIYSGMTFAYRKIDLLLDAFAQLREQLPSAQLVLVGGRPSEIDQLRAQAAALQIESAVTWIGQLPQEQITPYLQAADALVIPDTVTDVTASPLKLFEYLAAGRAVVLPDIPALAEVLPPAIGYYFRRGDAGALAQALATALTDPHRPEHEQAGQLAVAPHTYAARAARILALAQAVAQRYGSIAD
jgi:glycosyltransferase involved in cell wall biosynthesis